MRAAFWFSASLLLVGCKGEEPLSCTAPDGCNAVSSVSGRCECVDWKLVSDEVVPLKFLVGGIVSPAPGGEGQVAVGNYRGFGGGLPANGQSQVGTRIRVVFRDGNGKETPIPTQVSAPGASTQWGLVPLGPSTVALTMLEGNGYGLGGGGDVKPPSQNQIFVWMNPTLRVLRDAGGNVRAVWGWSGNCFDEAAACTSPAVVPFPRSDLEASPGTYHFYESFLLTLSPQDVAFIVQYDRLGTTPPPTADEVAADPRFVRVADLTVDTNGLISPDTTWTPCSSVARDDDFPVYATTEVPIPGGTVLVQQSWLTTTINCAPQLPGLVVGTSTSGCAISATAYVDKMFGSLAFLTESVSPACTGQP